MIYAHPAILPIMSISRATTTTILWPFNYHILLPEWEISESMCTDNSDKAYPIRPAIWTQARVCNHSRTAYIVDITTKSLEQPHFWTHNTP